MNVPLPPSATSGPLIQDTPCIGCQYNLRGLASDGLCPECGTPIERSVRGNFLRHADAAYVRRLASGTRMLFWTALVPLCMRVLTLVWQVLFSALIASGGASARSQAFLIYRTISVGITTVCSVFFLAGVWRVTTRDPAEVDGARGLGLPQALRASVVLLLIWQVFEFAMMLWGPTALQSLNMLWWLPLFLLMSLLTFATSFGLYLWFSRLAMRIPDPRLAGSTRIVMWCSILLTLPSFSLNLLLYLNAMGISSVRPEVLFGSILFVALQWMAAIGVFAVSVLWLILLARYRREFLAQAGLARVEIDVPCPPAGA